MPSKPFKPGNKHGFQPGASGNPGGKVNFSKILLALAEKYGIADPLTPGALRVELVKFHLDAMRDDKLHMRERQRSAEWLAAHVGLKPREVFEHHFNRSPEELEHMSDEELDAYIEDAESRAAAAKAEADAEVTDDNAVH